MARCLLYALAMSRNHPRQRQFIVSLAASLCVAAGLAGTAHADLTEDQKKVESDLRDFLSATNEGKKDGNRVANYFHRKPDDCFALVARGKELGIAPTQIMSGNPQDYLFKRAGEKCEEYRLWHGLVMAADVLAQAGHSHMIATGMELGSVNGEWAQNYGKVGTECIAKIDAMVAAGTPADVAVAVDSVQMTITEGKTKFCQGLIDWAKTFSVATEQAREAEAAAIREKYTKHGIGGDRLKLLVENDNSYPYGKGCSGALTDMKQIKKASLLFYWTEASSYGPWTVYRYQFKGDKLTKQSSRDFTNLDSAYKWCK
jgi:hypothetical protein